MTSKSPSPSDLILGIDFGSTTSRYTVYHDGAYTSMPAMPSYVGFDNATGHLITGRQAEEKYHLDTSVGVVYNLKEAILKDERFALGTESFLAVALVSQLLRSMKQSAQLMVGRKVTKAILTVPSFFSELHKGALKDAAILTGLTDVSIISEPTAALMGYRHYLSEKKKLERRTVLLLDSGGLTTDATLCDIGPNHLQVVGVFGDNRGGCHLVDEAIVQLITSQLALQGATLSAGDLRKITSVAEGVKIKYDGTPVSLTVPLEGVTRELTLSAESLALAFQPYFAGVAQVYNEVKKQGVVDQVLLIGGPFQSRYIRGHISRHIKEPIMAFPDQGFTVSRGAAIYGCDKTSGPLAGVYDLIPMAVGVEVGKGYFSKIIPQNAKCPSSHTKVFTTDEDNQSRLRINIYQGNRLMTKDCYYLGTILIDNIAPMEKGLPEIQVTLSINEEGLLQVLTYDRLSGARHKKVLSSENRLDDTSKKKIECQLSQYRDPGDYEKKLSLVQVASSWIYRLQAMATISPALRHHMVALTARLKTTPMNYGAVESALGEMICCAEKEWGGRSDRPQEK